MKRETHAILVSSSTVVLLFMIAILLSMTANQESAKNKLLAETDKNIDATRDEIQRIRTALPGSISDSLNKNDTYTYLVENGPAIDSLRKANSQILDRAYNAAYRHSMFNVPKHNTTVFTEFSEIPTVRNSGWKYWANDKKIRQYDRVKSMNPNLQRAIRSHFDSVANNRITQLQARMDSLLNKKLNLVNNHTK